MLAIKSVLCLAFFIFCECAGLFLLWAVLLLLEYAGLPQLIFPVWVVGVPVVVVCALASSFLLANRMWRT